MRAFLDGTQAVEFSLHTKTERYDFIRRTLIRFACHVLSKPDIGLLPSFMSHVMKRPKQLKEAKQQRFKTIAEQNNQAA